LEPQQSVDVGELASRLTAFGLRLFADFGLGGRDAAVAGVGLSVEDFVWVVLAEYVEGKLEHRASRGDLFSLLATALRNDIIDSLRKAAHAHEESRSSLPRESDSESDPPSLDELGNGATDLSTLLDEQRYRKRLTAALAEEPELTDVVRAVVEANLHKPREIAAALGISVGEVQNRKKKVRRRLIEYNLVERRTI